MHYREAYLQFPGMPFFLIESSYENEHSSTPQQLRSQAYEALLCGGMGYIFGNCPVWHFGSVPGWCKKNDWKAELNNQGSVSMAHANALFRSLEWYRLVPDFGHHFLTAGYGEWGYTDYATAAATAEGDLFIAYLPDPRRITVDLTLMSGKTSVCRWFDPSDGKFSPAGEYDNTKSQIFTPPGKGDYVLLIESK